MRFARIGITLLPAILAAPPLSPENSRAAEQKFDRITGDKLSSGESLILTEDEINSYLRFDYAASLPPGIAQPGFRLLANRVQGQAVVDFLEWRAKTGSPPGPLLAWLLRGQRRVEAVSRFTSSQGHGQVDIESVRIGGVPIPASAVRYLIENLVTPRYPAVVVGRRFPLAYRLREVRIERGRAVAVAK